jgi:hypothetical protein
MNEHDYLFDRSGPPDPDVERLERLLSPLAHPGGAAPRVPGTRAAAAPVRLRHTWRWTSALAAVAAAAAVLLIVLSSERDTPLRPPTPSGPALTVVGAGRQLAEEAWVESGTESTELRLGSVGQVTLDPGTRLQVRRLQDDETHLFLERGLLHARVSGDARPRFFQVDTPAARCVDLGCEYTLSVDAVGDAEVSVWTGQVAFENEGREVYVPAGAMCRATRAHGAGTPRFEDAAPALVEAVAAFDAAEALPVGDRRARADALLAATANAQDALSAWHLLQDPDDEVAIRARARLIAVAGAPEGGAGGPARSDAAARKRWKEHLASSW